MANVELHVFAANDLNGSPIWTTSDDEDYFEGFELRIDLRGLGRGFVTFSRQVGEALLGSGILAPENFVRVVIPAISETRYVFGFFITERGLTPVDSEEEAGENKTFGGPGPLFYLDRAINWDEQFSGANAEGFYQVDPDNRIVYLANDATIGNFFTRLMVEDDANPLAVWPSGREGFLPDLTRGFDGNDDSSGTAWASSAQLGTEADPFTLPIGQSWLLDLWAMLNALETVEATMDLGSVGSPQMQFDLWQSYGRDLTGTSFATDVVLLKEGENIAGNLTSRGKSRKKATHVLVIGAEGSYARVTKSGWSSGDYAKAVSVDRAEAKNHGVLERTGRRFLRKQDNGEDEITIGLGRAGFAPTAGRYFPGADGDNGHVWVGDSISLKTGTDAQYTALDYHYDTELVTAIDFRLAEASVDTDADTQAASWDVVLSLNVDRGSWSLPDNRGGGSGTHSHPPNPRLCPPDTACVDLRYGQMTAGTATNGDVESGATNWSGGGSVSTTRFHSGTQGYAATGTSMDVTYDFGSQLFVSGTRYVIDFWTRGLTPVDHDTMTLTFGDDGGDQSVTTYVGGPGSDPVDLFLESETGGDGATWVRARACWTPSADRTAVSLRIQDTAFASANFAVDDLVLYTAPPELHGSSSQAARCDHEHYASQLPFQPDGTGMDATDTQAAIVELDERLDALEADPGTSDHGALTGLDDDDHPQYLRTTDGGKAVINVVAASGATETLDLGDGNVHDVTLTADCTITLAGATAGVGCDMAILLRQGSGAPWEVTWPGSVEWVGGSAPTLETAENAWNWVHLRTIDGGTTWFGDGGAVGTSSGRWEVVLSGTAPPVAVTNEAEDDWLYAFVA